MNNRSALSLNEFCECYSIGRVKAYEEINAGRLQVVKLGRRTLVPVANAERWLAGLPTKTAKAA